MKKFKALIFDCDGTLVDSEYSHYKAWQYALQQQGGDLTLEEYFPYIGRSLQTNARLLAEKISAASVGKIIEDKKKYYEELQASGLPAIQPTIDFIHRLSREKAPSGRIKLGVASAGSRKEILMNLNHLQIASFFDVILSGIDDLDHYQDSEEVNKPKPYIYLEAAKRLNLSPSECVVIEDSRSGVLAGVNAGCFTVAIPNSYTLQQDLSAAHLKIDSFENISLNDFLQMITDNCLLS